MKTYAIAKLDNRAIASLDTEEIAHRIDNWVKGLCEKTRAKITPDMTDEQRDHVIAVANQAQEAFDEYIETQRAMLSARGLDKELVWTTAIVPTGEVRNGKEVCKIVTRETKLMIDDNWEDAHAAMKNDNRLDSDKFGFDREYTGRYRDADRIIEDAIEYESTLNDL